ncbi:MAG: TetR/AcrR family transcriptional regulator [Ilumatobacteraceae bacterium]
MPRRAQVSQADYVSAAFEISARSGMQSLTLKALGEHLGLDATAVYRHFRNKDTLLRAMLDQLLLGVLEDATPSDDPVEELTRLAVGLRPVLLAYPLLTRALALTPDSASTSQHFTDRVLDGLRGLGLEGESLVETYLLVENYVIGACLLDSEGEGDSLELRRRRFESVPDAAFRRVSKSVDDVRRVTEASFAAGVRMLLDHACRTAGRASLADA